jgi:hypothetical protein
MDTVCGLESGPKTEIKLAAGPLLLFLGPVRFLKPQLLLFWKDHFLFIVFQKLKFVSKTNYHIQLGGAISTLSCFYEGGRTWLLLFFLVNFILKYLFNFELISLNSLVCSYEVTLVSNKNFNILFVLYFTSIYFYYCMIK